MRTILLTGAFPYTSDQIAQIEHLGIKVIFLLQEAEELPIGAREVEVIVCNGLFLYHKLSDFCNLKYIQLTSAGFDRVPLDEIKSRGIAINNARGVYGIPMAEWAMAKILEYYKQLDGFVVSQEKCAWEKKRSLRELNGASAAIIGAGNIGQEVAKRLSVFGVTVTGYDVILGSKPFFNEVSDIRYLSTDMDRYDIVVLTAPLTEQTRHMISRDILKSMKSNAILVNIARGGLIDTPALVEVLYDRSDLFAALDVFEEEPLPSNSPLWLLPNVSVSPHNSFVSDGNNERMFSVIYNNLKAYLTR